ncbi:MAG: SUMF1/EgtB/PvdO family nonheme iron enzyme [Proteobacteria bacterium]|nr:SUMF1/EgtB/PvdO family nonheme iron enzyme [Pseudomonadota bacterium]
MIADPAQQARQGDAAVLAGLLQASRADTLTAFAAWQAAHALTVPQRPTLNPPLWELGHVGWFARWWLGRNPERARGVVANPDAPRPASGLDALYHSSRVSHAQRWRLPLPTPEQTRAELAEGLDETLALLRAGPPGDDALYFFRLALLHEDMHHEAALYMAQALGVPMPHAPAPRALPAPATMAVPACTVTLGHTGGGFAFDNECGARTEPVAAFTLDAHAVRWAEYLPFVVATGHPLPPHLRRAGAGWQVQRWGLWQPLDETEAACHLNQADALAWCHWAGRRLPTEAQWVAAQAQGMAWGDVWEWTATPFAPWPGFAPHPYADYSAPWFDGRPVLRGASFATSPRLAHAGYRNFFTAERRDVFAGFRSCASA